MSIWYDRAPTSADTFLRALDEACSHLTRTDNVSIIDPVHILRETLKNYNLTEDDQLEILLRSLADGNMNETFCQLNRTWISDTYDDSVSENRYIDTPVDHNFVLLFNFWMLGVIMPLIAIFGIIANSASIVVLTRPIMRSSTINIYLAGLSLFDSLLLLMSLLLYPSLSFCELDSTDPKSAWCRYFFFSALFTYPLSLIMQSCSVWTLTAITVDRFIAISWPLRSREWCTSKRAYIVLITITAWSVLYNLPAFFELQLKTISTSTATIFDEDFSIENENETIFNNNYLEESHFVLEQTDLRKQPLYKLAYKGYCYLFFMLLIPAGAMVVLNLFVSIKVRRAYRWRRAMSGKEEKERRCTIMAVLVVVTFLVFNSLAFVNNMMEIFSSDNIDEYSTKSTSYLLSVSVGNVLVAMNSATNFVIYCALGLRFRVMFCKIFCIEKCMESENINDRLRGSGCYDRPYQWAAVRYSVRNGEHSSRNGSERRQLLSMKYKFQVNNGSLHEMPFTKSCNPDQQNASRRSQ